MPFLLRSLPTLGLLVLLGSVARAQDVEHLPPFEIAGAAGTHSLQPSVVVAPTGGDPSTGLADAARYTAGLAVNDAGARGFGQTTTLRGFGNTPFFSDASAPVYLDDIPLASAFTFPTELYDFTQVTIHRGPQAGTWFGQSGDAGVIQLRSTPATADHSGNLRVSAGDYGLVAFGASVQATAGAHSELTAGIGGSQRDGYIYNTELDQDVDSRESVGGRVRWRYRPADDLEITVHALGQRTRDGAQALVPLGGPYHEVQRGKEGQADTKFGAVALGVSRKLGTGVLSSTTSYSTWELAPYDNRLVVFGGLDFDSALTQSQRTFAEEIRYRGEHLTGGLFYSGAETEGSTDRVFSGFPVEQSSFTTDADSFAAFGRGTFEVAPGWVLTPGLRVEYVTKDFVRRETIPTSQVFSRDEDWTAFLPSLAATRRFSEQSDLTLTVGGGFKPGGYSAYTGRVDLAGFGPQRNWGGEIAYSAVRAKGALSYTARGYAYWVSGYQIERSFAVPDSFTDEYLVVNAGHARLLGVELESVWRITRDLDATLALSLTQATLTDFTDPFTGESHDGTQVPFAPDGNGSLRVDYRPDVGFFAGAGITWTGTTYYDEQESDMFAQRSYTLVEAYTGFAFRRGELRVFGRNLGDEEYYSSITPGVGHATPGAPLTWGVELALRW
jgi:iron complex outermembrane receptor protein